MNWFNLARSMAGDGDGRVFQARIPLQVALAHVAQPVVSAHNLLRVIQTTRVIRTIAGRADAGCGQTRTCVSLSETENVKLKSDNHTISYIIIFFITQKYTYWET